MRSYTVAPLAQVVCVPESALCIMDIQGSNFTTATTANAVTSSAFAVMPFKFGF